MSRRNIIKNIIAEIWRYISSALVLSRNNQEIHIVELWDSTQYELVTAFESTDPTHSIPTYIIGDG